MGKHTDPDRGMSRRTGPARLPSAKTALRGQGSGPSPCNPSKQMAGRGLCSGGPRGAGLSLLSSRQQMHLGRGMKPLGQAAEHSWAPDTLPPG